MAYIQKDRVKETTTTNGTGAVTLAGAVAGFQAFSAVMSVADTCYYVIVSATGTDWETGTGTYSSASVLTRTTVLSSSNSGNAVSFTSGTKDVFMGPVAERVTDIAHGGTGATTAAGARTNLGVSTGTVTSVSGAGTVSGLTLTGTVTSSGSLTLGGAISTLNQNTTGNAATVTTNANLTGHVTSVGNAAVLGSFTSAQLAAALTDETGTGANVFATSPTLVTPLSNSLSAIPVASGAGNSLTLTAGSGVGTGAGGSLILQAGIQATSGGDGIVLLDGLTAGRGKKGDITNTVFGYEAFNAFTGSYSSSVAIGYRALKAATTGSQNVAVGVSALAASTTGSDNVAIGFEAGKSITTTAGVIAIGRASGGIIGNFSIAIGVNALGLGSTATDSIGIGVLAGAYCSGTKNIVVGSYAGWDAYAGYLGTGSSNVLVGDRINMGVANSAASNGIIIGASAIGRGTNTTVIGNISTTSTYIAGTINPLALPLAATVTAATGNGTTVTYTALNNFSVGQIISVTGLGIASGSSLNLANQTVVTASITQFTITNATVGVSSGTGTATIQSAGNSLTLTAGSGVGTGAGGSLILQAGIQATSGGDGKVIVKQVAGQTSNLQEWQNSAGTVLASVDAAGNIKTTALTVATLIAAATAGAGARAFVSDATLTTFATIPIGGGANGVPVYSDGTNWRIG